MSLNMQIVIGRLGGDPESKTVTVKGEETQVANFSVASDSFGETEWHRVIAWGKQAKFATDYLKKGGLVCVVGRTKTRSWEDKDGNKRYATELIAERVLGLGKVRDSAGETSDEAADDDQPF